MKKEFITFVIFLLIICSFFYLAVGNTAAQTRNTVIGKADSIVANHNSPTVQGEKSETKQLQQDSTKTSPPQNMDWKTILTIILGSSVLGSLLTNFFSWIIQSKARSRYNTYLALTYSNELEKYAYKCVNILHDDKLCTSSEGYAGKGLRYPPDIPVFPEGDFRDFNVKLLDDLFELPQIAKFAYDSISFTAEVVCDEEAHEQSRKSTIELASNALLLADRMRAQYGLKKRSLKFGNFDLRNELAKIEA